MTETGRQDVLSLIKQSALYQAILHEGAVREARKILLMQGRNRFGEPSPDAVALLYAMTDMRQFEQLAERLLTVSSWQELLALQEPPGLEVSTTYQAILRQGEAKAARRILFEQGRSRFGEPSAEVVAALDALTDVQQLEQLTMRSLQAASWQDLLGLNGPSRRGRERREPS